MEAPDPKQNDRYRTELLNQRNSSFGMSNLPNNRLVQMETTCGSLLYELQMIWDEVGESDSERDKMLFELEQECLEVYKRKVDRANRFRAQLRQAIADSEAELAAICSAMGELPVHLRQPDQKTKTLNEELRSTLQQLEEMQKRKCDRLNQFHEVLEQIQQISMEISGSGEYTTSKMVVDETDLSMRKLEELHRQLKALQKEKIDRLQQVLNHLNTLSSLCLVLGMDFKHTAGEVHHSLDDFEGSKNINDETIERLAVAIQRLREIKIQRMQKLQDLATSMLELWNLMDTPVEEQQMFHSITCNVAAMEHEITEPDTLSMDFLSYVEAEVLRLEELKASKMKELVLKKRSELEDICRRTRMAAETDTALEYAIEAMESGAIDPSCVLEQIELRIAEVKEEAFSRKEILEKVEKWLAACEEESWLEEYNRDENRYNAGRGAHLALKRAEKARAIVTKLPVLVEALASKTAASEKERGTEFRYDGVRLLSMLEEYSLLREEKEQECRRQCDQKRLQGQLMAEQEALFGSKPSPLKPPSAKKVARTSACSATANRRLSVGGGALQPSKLDFYPSKQIHGLATAAVVSHPPIKGDQLPQDDSQMDDGMTALRKPFSPINALSSKVTASNCLDHPNSFHNGISLKSVPVNNTSLTTPSKRAIVPDDQNRTPKAVPTPAPATPLTVSTPMQTATTLGTVSVPYGTIATDVLEEEIEYSFEERRAGFLIL
ncbi:65-kDa microtubule-associated protein 3-like [Magnolia sinica]|uniref:65-kDa microtubule-associated protein 3-like n=1 Tax=Magnolia sinica TaxID=86752 RepID=UPI00265AF5BE|nr:65-kDa microtubule-associated protein 3-like [Magnolia sinica]